MSFLFNLFRRPSPEVIETPQEEDFAHEPVQTRIVETVSPDRQSRQYLTQISLRRGMWIKHPDGVGIVKDGNPAANTVDIALVDSKGETIAHLTVDPFSLVQAKLNEIPEPRRPGPVLGAAKGYV